MKKLILEEEELFQPDENEAEITQAADISNFTGIIANLIKDEWEAVDGYNSAIVSLSAMGNEDVINTLTDIISEEYIHIGQLEKVLQMIIPEANAMKEGEQEAAEEIAEPEIEEVPELVEPEIKEEALEEPEEDKLEESLPMDDIPMDIAESVDFTEKVE